MSTKPNTNIHGLDVDYFSKKLSHVVTNIKNYKPDELARTLGRFAATADKSALIEDQIPEIHSDRVWALDPETCKFIADYILANVGEDQDPDGITAIDIAVGHLMDDDGRIVYGLYMQDSEYPEEGGMMLHEVPLDKLASGEYQVAKAAPSRKLMERVTVLDSKIRAFIEKHNLTCPESIFQRDRPQEDAAALVAELCEIVGYKKVDEEDEE